MLNDQQWLDLTALMALCTPTQLVQAQVAIEDRLGIWPSATIAATDLAAACPTLSPLEAWQVARSFAGHTNCYTEHVVADCAERVALGEYA